MDYPELDLLLGLVLIFTLVVSIALRILLSKESLPAGWSILSWAALIVHLVSALYIEVLFLQRMTPSFNRQIFLGVLLIGGIGALLTARLYRRERPRAAGILLGAQMVTSLAGIAIAFGLYRSLVPM